MGPLTDTIGLWRMSLCFCVFNLIKCQIELVIVMLDFAAVFCSSVGQNS